MLSTRDLPQNKISTQTESEGLEKIFQADGYENKAGVGISQNRYQNKGHKKRQRRTLYNT